MGEGALDWESCPSCATDSCDWEQVLAQLFGFFIWKMGVIPLSGGLMGGYSKREEVPRRSAPLCSDTMRWTVRRRAGVS